MQAIYWLSQNLLASQEGLCSTELVGWLDSSVGRSSVSNDRRTRCTHGSVQYPRWVLWSGCHSCFNMALNCFIEIISRMNRRRRWACRRVERRRFAGDCNETKRGFTMEHNESLMGKLEPAQLSQYNEQPSSWTDRIRITRQVLPNYCPT
jgi:hypothetical protein